MGPNDYDIRADREVLRSLARLGERGLRPTGSPQIERYRLYVWQFGGTEAAIRIERRGNRYELTVRRRCYDARNCGRTLDQTRPLTRGDWTRITFRLRALNFWELPSELAKSRAQMEACPGCDLAMTTDGEAFVLEGADETRHHAVDRSNPAADHPDENDFAAICEDLMRLAGLRSLAAEASKN